MVVLALSFSHSVGACLLQRFAAVAYRKKLEQSKLQAARCLQARIKAVIAFNAHTMKRVCTSVRIRACLSAHECLNVLVFFLAFMLKCFPCSWFRHVVVSSCRRQLENRR
jgi:hypothetical protein